MLGLPPASVELVELDVGGSFGVRGEFYPEDFLIPFAAMRVGRPVKWIEDRREHFLAANHSREIECELEIAARAGRDHPRPAGAHPRRHGRLRPHQRRRRARQGRAVPAGAVSHRRTSRAR